MDGLIAYVLSKKYAKSQGDDAKAYADEVGRRVEQAGFKVQIEQDRSILEGVGQPKIMYFLPKENPEEEDGYDEFIYENNKWEWVGKTDVDLSNYVTKDVIGDLNNLITTDKTSIVAAINEIAAIPNADTMQF